MIRPRVVASTVLAIVLAWLVYPRPARVADPAVENGYHAARAAQTYRQRAARLEDSLQLARRATDRVLQRAAAAIRELHSTAALDVPNLGMIMPDSGTRLIVGPHTASDTLVALPVARAKLAELVDSTRLLFVAVETVVLIERQRADSTIRAFQRALVAQDSVIVGLRSQLRHAMKPWHVRAVRGVEHALAGVACGGAGYVLAGPAGGLGAFVFCAAGAGVRR